MSQKKERSVESRTEPPRERSDVLKLQAAAAASGFLLSGQSRNATVLRGLLSAEARSRLTLGLGTMAGMLVTMPVVLQTNTDGLQIARQWASAFDYGHVLGPALCGLTTILHATAALRSRTLRWDWSSRYSRRQLLAGILTVGMVPFTVVAMQGTNDTLFALLQKGSAETGVVEALVGTWSRLHLIRCLFPLAGAIVGMSLVV